MTKCITCGDELHPERARKYNYCLKPECQAKNLKGLTMVAVGVNKSAEQYLLLDEDTEAELAQGKYHDQRRGTFGQPSGPGPAADGATRGALPVQPGPGQRGAGQHGPAECSPGRLAPGEGQPTEDDPSRTPRAPAAGHGVATPAGRPVQPAGPAAGRDSGKLGLSRYDVTQIILASRNRARS